MGLIKNNRIVQDKKQFISSIIKSPQKNKTTIISIFACFMTGLLLLLLFFFYTDNLQKMVKEENYRYLQEISSQINSNMKDKMEFHYSIIKTLGNSVERQKNKSLQSILSILAEEKKDYNYQIVGLIDEDGYLYSENGKVIYPDLIPFISEMNNYQKPVTSNVMNLNNKDSVAFLSPLLSIHIDNKVFKGIVAISDMDTLSDTLSLTMFENHGFAHVVTNTGAVVIRSNNISSQFEGYNLLTYFESMSHLEDITMAELKDSILHNQSGQFQYKRSDNTEMLVFYTPAQEENWYLFSIIPAELLMERTNGFYSQTVMACSVLTVIFITLIIIIIVTQRRRKRELMDVLYTDPVTHGISKLKFEEDVAYALAIHKNQYALVYINIDKFKFLNEQYGRIKADELLSKIYHIIDESISHDCYEYVSRLMADHFGVLLHTQNQEDIHRYVNQWNEKIRDFSIENNFSIPIKMTCGVYMLNESDPIDDIFVMLDKANVARKMIKGSNRDTLFAVYDDALKQQLYLEQELESRQEIALSQGEFQMYLQPKYNPYTNEIAGAEGLARWITDKRIIYPDQFIPLFESNGFIVKLDLYIFEEACRFIDTMIQRGYKPIPISVNLSRRNLNNPHFIEQYISIWRKYDFDSRLLEFEITENLIYENMELLGKIIMRIHEEGFKVSMDDFGSGYSSLNMLKSVNVDFVKLDREFFLNYEQQYSHKSKIIVNAMIDLCKELDICVVSEGIETKSQVDFLRKLGCDLIQGYYYSKPIPKEELLDKIIHNEEENNNEKVE